MFNLKIPNFRKCNEFYKSFLINFQTWENYLIKFYPINTVLRDLGINIQNNKESNENNYINFFNEKFKTDLYLFSKINPRHTNFLKHKKYEKNYFLHQCNNNRFKKKLLKLMYRNFTMNFDMSSMLYLEEIPRNYRELEIYLNKNSQNLDYLMNNKSYLINSGQKLNFDLFSLALFLNKFSHNSEKKKKSINNELLEILRKDNYSALICKSFNDDMFLKLLENLHITKLSELDKEIIQNKFLNFLDEKKLSEENIKKVFNCLYFYDITGNKLQKIKRNLFNEIKKNYDNYKLDELYFYNSCLIFHNSKDLVGFIEPLYKKLDFLLDLKNKTFPLEQILLNYLPIPKLISESKNLKERKPNKLSIESLNSLNSIEIIENKSSNTSLIKINNLENIDIYEKSLIKFEKFLTELSNREELINVEYLIPILSNTSNYLELKSEIFDLYVDKLYKNLAALSNDNYIELFFLIIQVSKNEIHISQKRRKLAFQIYNILLSLKTEPRILIDIDKFYIYLNIARSNLNNAFNKLLENNRFRDSNPKNFDLFKKIIKISIDIFPFSVREKEYTPQLLEEIFNTFNKILSYK